MNDIKITNLEESIFCLKIYDVSREYSKFILALKEISTSKYSLSEYELNMIMKNIKNYLNNYLVRYKKLEGYKITYDYLKEDYTSLLSEFKHSFKETIKQIQTIIEVIIKTKENSKPKTQLYLVKLLSDIKNIQYEVFNEEKYLNEAKKYFQQAKNIIDENKFNVDDYIILCFYLNFSVFLYKKEKKIGEALELSRFCITQLNGKGNVKLGKNSDVKYLSEVIKDNISIWENEINKESKKI